jgi:hypothetical protein
MTRYIYPDHIAIVDAQGRNMATFFGALRYVEAELFMKRHA